MREMMGKMGRNKASKSPMVEGRRKEGEERNEENGSLGGDLTLCVGTACHLCRAQRHHEGALAPNI